MRFLNRQFLLLALTGVVLMFGIFGGNETAVAQLVGYWPMNGEPLSAAGDDAAFRGEPIATLDRLGNAGGAIAFRAANKETMLIPDGAALGQSPTGSISLWVRWDSTEQTGFGNDPVRNLFGPVLSRQNNNQWSVHLLGLSHSDPDQATLVWRPNAGFGKAIIGTTPVGTGIWRHIAITFRPGEQVLYLDGARIGSMEDAVRTDYRDVNIPLAVGGWIGDGNAYSTASIDDLAIWNNVLSPEHIYDLFVGKESPLTLFPPPIVPDITKASWIWNDSVANSVAKDMHVRFRRIIEVPKEVRRASIMITCDNDYDLFVNGQFVGGDSLWESIEIYPLETVLHEGENIIAVDARCVGGAAGLIAALTFETEDGIETVVTGADWLQTTDFSSGWTKLDYEDDEWSDAVVLGPLNTTPPWAGLKYDRHRKSPVVRAKMSLQEPEDDFEYPEAFAYLEGFYILNHTGMMRDGFGPVFIGQSRSYYELDHLSPVILGHKLKLVTYDAKGNKEVQTLLDVDRPATTAEPAIDPLTGRVFTRKGLLGRPSASYDGKTIYFCMAYDWTNQKSAMEDPHSEEANFFHIWQINPDGTGLKQVTFGPWHDFDPTELPDGRILFSSSRFGTREEYHGNLSTPLYQMEKDGSDIRPFTYHIVGDHEPVVTSQGMIAYIRRDHFAERAKVEVRIDQARPDGTNANVLLGADRTAIGYDPFFAAEHDKEWLRIYGAGSMAPLDDGNVAAVTNFGVTVSGRRNSGSDAGEKFQIPLVPFEMATMPEGRLLCTTGDLGKIVVLEPTLGMAYVVHEADKEQIHSVCYVGERDMPPQIPAMVPPEEDRALDKTGLLMCQNVRFTKQTNADLERIKAVRIYVGDPLVVPTVQHTLGHIGVIGEELGTIPLAPDGSFYARVPADKALAIQAIDAQGRAVINELSWLYVRPGEVKSCVGCHSPRAGTGMSVTTFPLATQDVPVPLLGQGNPHRYRVNNAANGGVLNLQFDRFREASSISAIPNTFPSTGKQTGAIKFAQLDELTKELRDKATKTDSQSVDDKVSAIRRLALFRDHTSTPVLVEMLADADPLVRLEATVSLSACGNRLAVEPLLKTLDDSSPTVSLGSFMALVNMTGCPLSWDPYDTGNRATLLQAIRSWFETNSFDKIEAMLIERLNSENSVARHDAAIALGHIGDVAAKKALRQYVETTVETEELRNLMEAMLSLGYLQDTESVELLSEIVRDFATKEPEASPYLQELGWLQRYIYITATAVEALGKIGANNPQTREQVIKLISDVVPSLLPFHVYTWWQGDHDWLRSCHSCMIHYRVLEALDALDVRGAELTPAVLSVVLQSVPVDPDRALLLYNDVYEEYASRLAAAAGRSDDVILACLAVLGNKEAIASKPDEQLVKDVSVILPATEVGPQSAVIRAAQMLAVCLQNDRFLPMITEVLDRYRLQEMSRDKSWVCFFLSRGLGRIQTPKAVDLLVRTIKEEPREADFGYYPPPQVYVYRAMQPFFRTAAVYSLGEIGDKSIIPLLLELLSDHKNAVCLRVEVATALGKMAPPDLRKELGIMAEDYPDESVRIALQKAADR